jgi:DNA-binding SARP family transcriptional activator
MQLRIYLLGPCKVEHAGRVLTPHDWGRPKDRALLKLLALHAGHVVPQDLLLDALWPNLSPSAAVNSLQVAVSRVRKLLGPAPLIQRVGVGYMLEVSDAVWIDVEEFRIQVSRGRDWRQRVRWAAAIQSYRAATGLYRGDLCEDDPYEDWALQPREELRQTHLGLLEELADCLLHVQARDEARELCERGLAQEPTREGLYVQLMRSHMAGGQVAEALQVYDRCRRVLADELGVDPGPTARALYAQLLQADELDSTSVTAPPYGVTESAAATEATSNRGRTEPNATEPGRLHLPCVGRERELATLAEALAAAQRGDGHMVLVHGEPGIGKTRLLDEIGRLAEARDMRLLRARCYELERDLPYAPMADALGDYLAERLDPAEVSPAIGEWGPQVAALLPILRELMPDLPPHRVLRPEAERSALFAGVRHFLAALARTQPLALLVDDLHWADVSTIQLLEYLASRLAGSAVLIVGTYRTGEVSPDRGLGVLIERISTDMRRQSLIELPCLKVEDVVALLPALENIAGQLHFETDGHPLFLVETLRTLIETGVLQLDRRGQWVGVSGALLSSERRLPLPPTVREAIRWRFTRLNERERRVLMAAAVAARGFRSELLTAVMELSSDSALDALEALVGRQLLRVSPAGRGFDFRHDLIQEVIYAELTPDRRRDLHARTAHALQAHADEQRIPASDVAAELAHHWRQAECWMPAFRYALLAGDHARGSFAPREALTHYLRAADIGEHHPAVLEPADQARLLERLGRAYSELGEPAAALQEFDRLLQLARSRGDRLLEGRALAALADARYWRHEFERSETLAAEALEVAGELDNQPLRAGGLVTAASVAMARGRTEDAERHCKAVLALTGDRPPPGDEDPVLAGARLNALGWVGLLREFQCEHEQALPAIEASLRLGLALHNPFLTGRSRFALGMSLGNRGRYEEALTTLHEAFRLAEEGGDRYFLPRLPNTIGWIHSELGDLKQADEWNRRSVALARETGWLEAEANALVNMGVDALRSRRPAQARACLENAAALIDRDEWFTWRYRMRLLIGLGELALEDGSPDDALEFVARALRLAEPTGSRKHLGRALLLSGQAMLAANAPLPDVVARFDRARLVAHATSHPPLTWTTALELADVHDRLGQEVEAAECRAEAEAAVESVLASISDSSRRRTFLGLETVQRALANTAPISN